MAVPNDAALVFNVVWTGTVFPSLKYFVTSLMDRCEARFRFVANACPPDQIDLIERFASGHSDRVVEVLETSPEVMVAHGVALDETLRRRDDGSYFCFVDTDILATGPFLHELTAVLEDHDAVTSGEEVWTESNVVPEGHPGVGGRHFYDRHGFVFGSPHLAIYRRDPLLETLDRWKVGLGTGGGPETPDAVRRRLAELGHDYLIYDTAKIANILFQGDGHRLTHRDLPEIVHIGGLSHFLAPARYVKGPDGTLEPEWIRFPGVETRARVASYTAEMLRCLRVGSPVPEPPDDLSRAIRSELSTAMAELRMRVDQLAEMGP